MSHSFSDSSKNVSFGYAFNPAGQLVTATSSNGLYTYASPSTVTTNYTVDGQNKYTTVGGVGITSDARGNLSGDGGRNYAYDEANELTDTSTGPNLIYDGLGRLYQSAGSVNARFIYDGSQIIGEYNTSGALADRYIPGAGVDQPLMGFQGASTAASGRLWSIANHQGSVIALANATTTIAINTYDESGLPGPSNQGRFQFDGMPYIPDAGLYQDRARTYNPKLGRFMQTDPIGYGDGMNWYNYVHGDPVNGSDPSGLADSVSTVSVTANKCPKNYTLQSINGDGSITCVRYFISYNVDTLANGLSNGIVGGEPFLPSMPPQNGQSAKTPDNSCKPANNLLQKIANGADAISNGATFVSATTGLVALATSETIVGGVTFGTISAGAGVVSIGASGVGAAANFFGGRAGNAAVDVFSAAFNAATLGAAGALPPVVQYLRGTGATLVTQDASAICPG